MFSLPFSKGLSDDGGPHRNDDVVVLGDIGYDCKAIQNTIVGKGWDFIIALKKKRASQDKLKI
ncbi:MAG: transposase [Desulfobacteraceae bacterium]|nr:transposase [Desulfobacteraceae bacterium]